MANHGFLVYLSSHNFNTFTFECVESFQEVFIVLFNFGCIVSGAAVNIEQRSGAW